MLRRILGASFISLSGVLLCATVLLWIRSYTERGYTLVRYDPQGRATYFNCEAGAFYLRPDYDVPPWWLNSGPGWKLSRAPLRPRPMEEYFDVPACRWWPIRVLWLPCDSKAPSPPTTIVSCWFVSLVVGLPMIVWIARRCWRRQFKAPLWAIGGIGTVLLLGLGAQEMEKRAAERVAALHQRCADRLYYLGWILHRYAKDHGDCFPDDLAALVTEGYVTSAEVFICPRSGDRFGPVTDVASLAERLRKGEGSYIYLGQGLCIGNYGNLVREKQPHADDGEIATLCVDGWVWRRTVSKP